MSKILWFSNAGDYSSFSRITQSVIPYLNGVTLLSNKKINKNDILIQENLEHYNSFKNGCRKDLSIKEINMKYCLILISDVIYQNDFDYLVICNGIYEIEWYMSLLTENPKILINKNYKKTKVVVWTPIDYIPIKLNHIQNADYIITMNPIMSILLKNLLNKNNIDWLGHGSDISNDKYINRKKLTKILNKSKFFTSKNKLDENDIVILNANNIRYTNRKRLDTTILAFIKLNEEYKNIKLWIHTDLNSFNKMIVDKKINIDSIKDKLILSNSSISSYELSLIYRFCQINLQTSTGEGWSLTNMESALYGSIQVVPDFLACKFHFEKFHEIPLIPTKKIETINENNDNIIVGVVNIEDTVNVLKIALTKYNDPILKQKYIDYAKSYKWKDIADKFKQIIE